jgi:hypothetical protein
MFALVRTRWGRLFAALMLGAFLATGPGLSVAELLTHIQRGGEPHERLPHFETAGTVAHADHCQLGLAHSEGRLPAPPPIRFAQVADRSLSPCATHASPPAALLLVARLPRAPPVPA